jgi:hypothetical protein
VFYCGSDKKINEKKIMFNQCKCILKNKKNHFQMIKTKRISKRKKKQRKDKGEKINHYSCEQ